MDVLVDGTYKDELHDPTLKWKGSSNQRVIDVQKSMENQEIWFIENKVKAVSILETAFNLKIYLSKIA